MIVSCWICLRMRNVSDKSCRENQSTHFIFDKHFFRLLCGVWDNKCIVAFSLQQSSHQLATLLRYTYIARLVQSALSRKPWIPISTTPQQKKQVSESSKHNPVTYSRRSEVTHTTACVILTICFSHCNCDVHSNAHKVIAGFFLSPEPEVT
jgi:hypothetical protein